MRIDAIPIKVPDTWPNEYPSQRKLFMKKHPFWGWLIAFFLDSRFRTLDKEVERKLKSRTFSIEEAWQEYPNILDDVKKIQILLNEQLWGFPPVFVPDDSYWLLGQLLTGDLCEVEMIMAIEEKFKIAIPDDYFDEDVTMLKFITYINKKYISSAG